MLFKKPARRILSALFQGVKKHLHEMVAAGAVQPGHSIYSSFVVMTLKKDGIIKSCIDVWKLTNKTVNDAFAIPRVGIVYIYLPGQNISPNYI